MNSFFDTKNKLIKRSDMTDIKTKNIILNLYKKLSPSLLFPKLNSYKINISGKTATEFPAKKTKTKTNN